MSLVNSAFDFVFEPLTDRPPIFVLLVFAIATALVLLLSYRFLSNERALRGVKNLLQAHLLELRLFGDQPGVVVRAYGKLLRNSLSYFGWLLIPLLFAALPIALLIPQMDLRLNSRPFLPGDPALLIVRVDDRAAADRISLQLPEGVVETAPLIRIPADREVIARLETRLVGRWEILVNDGAASISKEIVTGVGLERLSARRLRGGWLDRWLDPGEPGLPQSSPVSCISIRYPGRPLTLGPVSTTWLPTYVVLTLVAAIVLRPFFRTEF